MSCLSDAVLLGFVEHRLAPAERDHVEAHVDTCPACRRLLAMLAPAEPKTLGNRYEIGRLIGRGSMGRVFEALDRETGDTVAVKRVHHESAETRARFRREARILDMFRHPGVVRIREVVEEPSGIAIVMDRLHGETLEQRLRSGTLSVAEAQEVLHGLFQIVAAAHERGIVHRDLKPSNVYFDAERLYLLDFGLATLAKSDALLSTLTRLTKSGSVLGTHAYMPPERLEGKEAGPAGDVWSAGAIGWRMLVGSSPHELDPPLPSIAQVARDVPSDLADWLDRCLSREPELRPEASAVSAALG